MTALGRVWDGRDNRRRSFVQRLTFFRGAAGDFRQSISTGLGSAGEPALPLYDVTLAGVLRGALPFGKSEFRKATERTVDSGADLRWGTDSKGFRRILHPNGVCLTGRWEITEQTEYSGYFAKTAPRY